MARTKLKRVDKSKGMNIADSEPDLTNINASGENSFISETDDRTFITELEKFKEIKRAESSISDSFYDENKPNSKYFSAKNHENYENSSSDKIIKVKNNKNTNFYKRMNAAKLESDRKPKNKLVELKKGITLNNLEKFMNGDKESTKLLESNEDLKEAYILYRKEKITKLLMKKNDILDEIDRNYSRCVKKLKESRTCVESAPFINFLIGLKNPYSGKQIIRKSKTDNKTTSHKSAFMFTLEDQSIVFEGNDVLLDGNKIDIKNHAWIKEMKDLIAKHTKKGNIKKINS